MSRDWRDERIEQLEGRVKELESECAEKDLRLADLEQRLIEALKQIADLAAKLGQNSRNSHKPPSSDTP